MPLLPRFSTSLHRTWSPGKISGAGAVDCLQINFLAFAKSSRDVNLRFEQAAQQRTLGPAVPPSGRERYEAMRQICHSPTPPTGNPLYSQKEFLGQDIVSRFAFLRLEKRSLHNLFCRLFWDNVEIPMGSLR
jgi:hypothetical protein